MIESVHVLKFSEFYRRKLTEEVMPFWRSRSFDPEFGGFFTCFDGGGNLTSTDKYVWMQGRNLWMFAAMFNRLGRDPGYLAGLADACRFLVRYAYAGNGRWHYALDRRGKVLRGTVSIYSDMFMLAGLCEYAVATDSREYDPVIAETLATLERNFDDPECKDLHHGRWLAGMIQHGPAMTALDTFTVAAPRVGVDRVAGPLRQCLERILFTLARSPEKALFEVLNRDGSIADAPECRVLNPGHALESMWFCMKAARMIHAEELIPRAVEVTEWMYEKGLDPVFGGLYSFIDARGGTPAQTGWHRATSAGWDDKVWWVHSEALHTLIRCHAETGDPRWLQRFLALHEYAWKHFYDPACGEWNSALYRDGGIKDPAKGSEWKAAYHLPRALLFVHEILRSLAGKETGGVN